MELACLPALIHAAESDAGQGCGQSDVLFEARVQQAYRRILSQVSDAHHTAAEALLVQRGYKPNFEAFQAKENECSLTGIDEYCCPCGRHL